MLENKNFPWRTETLRKVMLIGNSSTSHLNVVWLS